MSTIQSSLFAAAIAVCVLCAFLANGEQSKPRKRSRYLVAYLALEALWFALEWLMQQPTSPAKALWLGALMALSFFVAPCLWLFAREITEDQTPSIGSLPARHFVVVATGIALTLPLIQTTHLGPDYADPNYVPTKMHSLFIHATMLACVALFLCQVPYYLRECVRILARHVDHTKALFSNIEHKTLNTLRILIFVVVTTWFVGLLRALYCITLGRDTGWGLLFTAMEVGVTVWALFVVMRQSTIFSVAERKLVLDLFGEGAESAQRSADGDSRYARSALDPPTRARIRGKLHEAMSASHLYRDNRVTLRGLCQHIKENPHYVSQVINQDLGTSFYDLINVHRVESAKRMLVLAPEKTVIEIALEVGFNSKSTFNAAFRQHTGSTPTAYRTSQLSRPEPEFPPNSGK
ncbi:MAG: helix-turn-helix domain-containing protein [Steroidobacteraceae bacterium]